MESKELPTGYRCGNCGAWVEIDDEFPDAFEAKDSQEDIDYKIIKVDICNKCHWLDEYDFGNN